MAIGIQESWNMVRGDSQNKTITVKVNGVKRNLVTGDKVEMTVRKKATDDEILLHKEIITFTDGNAELILEPGDTSGLEFRTYKYDIQITFATGEVITPIYDSNFKLHSEITQEVI